MTTLHYTKLDPTDDAQYLNWVESVVGKVEGRFSTDQTYVVKIDNWFGKRWLGFSGRSLGVFEFRKPRLTLPPFVPSRVLSQQRFSHTQARTDPWLHVWQSSGQNLQRYVDVLVQDSNVFWYSGGSGRNDRASFMAYVSTPDGFWPWYVGLQRTDCWRVVETLGIPQYERETLFPVGGLTSA
jgi:hypothetical protein